MDEVDKNVHHVHLLGTNGSTDAENHDGVHVFAFPLQPKGEVRLLEPPPNLACWVQLRALNDVGIEWLP